jgi:hypothetical protein
MTSLSPKEIHKFTPQFFSTGQRKERFCTLLQIHIRLCYNIRNLHNFTPSPQSQGDIELSLTVMKGFAKCLVRLHFPKASLFIVRYRLLTCWICAWIHLYSQEYIICHIPTSYMSRDGAFGIVTGYELDDREVRIRVPVRSRIFTSPCLPDRLWSPLSLL